MIKKYKLQLIISSLVILLPIAIGLVLWTTLPERFATHWTFTGEADGWSGKAFAVFVPPLIMLATHWFGFFVTSLDPKAANQHKKVFGMIFWICPVLSLSTSGMMFALALGTEFNITSILMPGMAIAFIGIGNYMPKCRQNHTMGIKVPWALANEENWNATHRFGGKVWVAGGLAMFFLAFLPSDFAMIPMFLLILILAFVPGFYSWWYYQKQNRDGAIYEVYPSATDETTRKITNAALVFTAIILILVGIFVFSGSIEVTYDSDSFTMDASFWNPITVNYDDIDSIEYREGNISGSRLWGLGSFRLLLGNFENEEFGYHTRYTYYKPEACIVLTVKGKTMVISGRDAAQTTSIYNELTARTEG